MAADVLTIGCDELPPICEPMPSVNQSRSPAISHLALHLGVIVDWQVLKRRSIPKDQEAHLDFHLPDPAGAL
jgi:hypothetical protein